MKQILFIGQDASKTGAPFVLLHLMRWLKQNAPEYHIELLLLAGGELEEEFRKVCSVHVLYRQISGSGIGAVVEKSIRYLRKKLGGGNRLISRLASKHSLVLGNTAVTLEHLTLFKRRGNQTILWMHELDYAVDHFFLREQFLEMAELMDGFIVGSNAVHEMLLRRGVTRPVEVVYEFLNTAEVPARSRVDIRSELDIPADAFVVGACGTIEWRKGIDLFVQVAKRSVKESPNIYFIWVGGRYPGTDTAYDQIQFDVRKLGLEKRIIFVDIEHDLYEYYQVMDVFLLPSREDPFPLVCLEAAAFEKPILCFENAGGMPEFVEEDAGFVVPYLDVEVMCQRVAQLHDDPQLLSQLGQVAANKVRNRHDVSQGGAEILKIVDGFHARKGWEF